MCSTDKGIRVAIAIVIALLYYLDIVKGTLHMF